MKILVFCRVSLWLGLLLASYGVKSSNCPEGEFLNLEVLTCQNCSKCPDNQIYRFACTNTSDAVCISFKEFNFDHVEGGSNEEALEVTLPIEKSKGRYNNDVFDSSRRGRRVEVEGIPTKSSEDQYWKNLAFALIGVLCVLIIVATMVVWYACRKLHASVQMKRPEDDDSDDADNGYVVIRSIRQGPPPNPIVPTVTASRDTCATNNSSYHLLRQQRLVRPYRPKRRLLNEYDDDVFESEDSAGSRSSRRVLSSIPEHSDLESTSSQPIV